MAINQSGDAKHTPNTPAPWRILPLFGWASGKVTGYTVERVHNPYTDRAHVETFADDRGRNRFPTIEAARAAVDKATGGAA